MPKKFNIAWSSDAYDGFAIDVKALKDLGDDITKNDQNLKLVADLRSLMDGTEDVKAKDELNKVINKILEINEFLPALKKHDKNISSLASDKYEKNAVGEGLYRSDILTVKNMLKTNKYRFFESATDEFTNVKVSQKGAMPLDIRAAWDRFNLLDDYNSYDKNEELFKHVDDMLNKYIQMQNMLNRIFTLQDNYETEHRLQERLVNKEKQMARLGKILTENPGIILSDARNEETTVKKMFDQSESLLQTCQTNVYTKNDNLKKAKESKETLQSKKGEYDTKKSEAAEKLNKATAARAEAEKVEAAMRDIMNIPASDLSAFKEAHTNNSMTSKEITDTTSADSISPLRTLQHKYSDEAEKHNKEIQQLTNKNKALQDFVSMVTPVGQYRLYPDMLIKIWNELGKLPASMDIDYRGVSIAKLKGILRTKMEKDDRVAILYEAVSVAEAYCPKEFRLQDIDSDYFEDLNKKGMDYQGKLLDNKSYVAAIEISKLLEEGQYVADELTEMKKAEEADPKKKDPKKKKSLEARQKEIRKKIEKVRKSKDYIKDSEKILDLMKKSQENTKKANDCRYSMMGVFDSADQYEAKFKKEREDKIRQSKTAVVEYVKKVLEKLPEGSKELTDKMKEAAKVVEESIDLYDVTKAYEEFNEALAALNQNAKYASYDRNKEVEDLQKEVSKWDYDSALTECDKNITKCQDELAAAEKDFDDHRKTHKEYSDKYKKIVTVNLTLDQMLSEEREVLAFESEPSLASELKNDLRGTVFFTQLQKTFSSFAQRKDHNKGDHNNTDEYRAMDTKLTNLLELNPAITKPAYYKKALTDLKNAASAYIDKKNAQHFHWIPSKLRKYRLQYAKGLVDMCTSQLGLIDESDFSKNDPAVTSYLDRIVDHPTKWEKRSKEEYINYLTDKKQEGIEAYKRLQASKGISEEKKDASSQDQQQMDIMQQPMNQVEQPVGNVEFNQGAKNKELLQS